MLEQQDLEAIRGIMRLDRVQLRLQKQIGVV